MHRIVSLICILLCCLLGFGYGCGSESRRGLDPGTDGPPAPTDEPVFASEGVPAGDPPGGSSLPGFPAFPGDGAEGPCSAYRKASDGTLLVPGDEVAVEHGRGNRAGELSPYGYILLPGAGERTAWGIYRLEGLTTDRPVEVCFEVAQAPLIPHGDDPLALNFYIGFADYTSYLWEWHGPFDEQGAAQLMPGGDDPLELNSETFRDRYVSEDGVLHYAVVTVAGDEFAGPGNPEGMTAVEVRVGIIDTKEATAPDYLTTRPHFAAIQQLSLGTSGKGTSALDPQTQYVTLNWAHVYDPYNDQNEAVQYKVYRKGPLDEYRTAIGSVNAPETTYTDPLDNATAIPEVVPGATYTYYLRAYNPAGYTPYDLQTATIPLLPPADLQATDAEYPDRIALTWQPAEGATGYEIYRDDQGTPIATVGDVGGWADTEASYSEIHTYWLKATNAWAVSDFSESATGRRFLWPPASFAATDGEYPDKIVLTWNKSPHAIGYKVYRDGQDEGDVIATLGDVDTWEDTIADNLTQYTYWLRATFPGIESGFSDPDIGCRSSWQTHVVDTGDVLGDLSLAILDGKPAIAYNDDNDLVFARATTATPGSSMDWQIHVVDAWANSAGSTSMIVLDGKPIVSYPAGDVLAFAQATVTAPSDGSDWQTHTVTGGGTPGDTYYTSLVAVDGKPAISYKHTGGNDLNFARALTAAPESSADWQVHVVDDSGVYDRGSLAVLGGKPAISYSRRDMQPGSQRARFARATTASPGSSDDWEAHYIDPAQFIPQPIHSSLAVLDGRPVMTYSADDDLVFARALTATPTTDADWQIHAVDVGRENTSLAVLEGKPAVSYAYGDHLYFAWAVSAAPESSADWQIFPVASSSELSKYSSLVVLDGKPAITFKTDPPGEDDLYFARAE